MNQVTKACSIAVCLIGVLVLILFSQLYQRWLELSTDIRALIVDVTAAQSGYLIILLVLLVAGLVLTVLLLYNYFVVPLRKLIEETNLIQSANPEHRIRPTGSGSNKKLAEKINALADMFSESQKNIENEISLSRAEMEREKNILAAFIGELQEGVLICNAEGSIMFYNRRAQELFTSHTKDENEKEVPQQRDGEAPSRTRETFIGIGRSIFNIIDKSLIVHALDEVAEKLHDTERYISSSFVVATRGGKLLRIDTVPVVDKKMRLSGFVFSATDITERLHRDNQLDELIQTLMKNIRASVGGIQSSIETMIAYPGMEPSQLSRFKEIILDESKSLGRIIENAGTDYPDHLDGRWPLVPMPTDDLIEKVRRKAADFLGISLYIERSDRDTWIKVESYCGLMILLFVLNRLKDETGSLDFFCRVGREERLIFIELSWKGAPMLIKTLRSWNEEPLVVRREGLELSLQEVLVHHGGNLWLHALNKQSDRAAIRLIFPACEHEEDERKRTITISAEKSRPVFYDFDLFSQQHLYSEISNRSLADLEYTVFDTETTGLAPRAGDEILSIGAVRVVHGKVLQDELFDQVVDPQRDIPITSIRIHGIQPEMVKGQPTIERVLPSFFDFCENTVMIAHNAAFDMLMLKMKERATGISFTNPVLDTLLLWDILHPSQEKSNFSTIAEMLGVRIVGRHTALGDALTTAEVFCKMIPLLAKSGIHTLGEARAASQKSKYARLEY